MDTSTKVSEHCSSASNLSVLGALQRVVVCAMKVSLNSS
jgi:hypothetical protein